MGKNKNKKETIMICCTYFPPNQSLDNLTNFLDKLSDSVVQAQTYLPTLIMVLGDFNLGNIYLKPEYNTHSGITNFDTIFHDTIHSLNFTQLICEPTRINERTGNLRDLILVSDQRNIANHAFFTY